MKTDIDSGGQLWFLGVSFSWRTFGRQVWTGLDKFCPWVFLLAGGQMTDRDGQQGTSLFPWCLFYQVPKDAEKCGFGMSFQVGRNLGGIHQGRLGKIEIFRPPSPSNLG